MLTEKTIERLWEEAAVPGPVHKALRPTMLRFARLVEARALENAARVDPTWLGKKPAWTRTVPADVLRHAARAARRAAEEGR